MNGYLLIKGIIIGIAKIVPGFSGAVLMISFQLYDRAIHAITNFFSNWKENFWFLFSLGTGVLIGVILFSRVILFLLTRYYFYTFLFFLGLIVGGIPIICQNIKKRGCYFYTFLVVVFMFISSFLFRGVNLFSENTYPSFFRFILGGFMEAVGTIVPGVSSTALLMLIGVYDDYMKAISFLFVPSLWGENFSFFFFFGVGLFVGIILLTLLIEYLFRRKKEETYSVILGISLGTVLLLLFSLIPYISSVFSVTMGVILFFLGFFLTLKLG